MKTVFNSYFLVLALVCCSYQLMAQESKPTINFYARKQRGIGLVTADSTFSLNFQFRMQNRALVATKTDSDLAPDAYEFRVRRLRFKFEGFVYNPKLTYYIQLSFSRGDMDWRGPDNATINSSPNVVRDAVIYYNPNKYLRLGFGQTKLPGNRQRVVSSGDLQFYDRSIVNAAFNIDRDFGFFAHYTGKFFVLRGALTSGEGRNAVLSNSGLAYTGRVEFLPFGKFTGNNDYIEGDLEREKSPKLSIAATFHENDNALRQNGQLGNDLYDTRTLKSFEVDALFKFNGFAWYNEFNTRSTNDPVTVDPGDNTKSRIVYVGKGYLSQMSYLFKNNFEIAGRYAVVVPDETIYNNPAYSGLAEKKVENIELGVTKYLNGHRLKIQGGVVYTKLTDLKAGQDADRYWTSVFQIELGI